MATTTRVLDANVNGTVYTSNANSALEALDTCHSGTTAPTDEVSNGKLWLDTSTTPGILKIYNNATWAVVHSGTVDINAGTIDGTTINGGTIGATTPAAITGTTLTATGAFTSLGIDDNATSTAITIDSSENVGIGAVSPTGSLDVARSGSHEVVFRTTSTGDPTLTLQADGTNNGKISYVRATEGLTFSNSGSERMRIDSSGHVIVPAGVTLGTATGVYSAANTLDDYEEGTWSVACTVGTCTGVNTTYTKVGDLVTVTGRVNSFSNIGVASQVILVGIPFAVSGDWIGSIIAKELNQLTECSVYASGSTLTFYGVYSGTYDTLLHTDLKTGAEIYFSITYKTTA